MKNISNSMCSYKSGNARSVTILTCTGNYIAAKTHALGRDGRRETNAYRVGMHFDMRVVAFKDLPELFDILVRAAADSRQFVIRGSLMDDAPRNAAGHVRRTSRKQTDGEEPSFQDTDREWVMIDFDKVDNPNELDPISIEAMEHLRTLLPPAFRGVSCIYSLSASAGMTDSDMISGHLWFVLDKPVSNRELKVWLSGYPVDTALFNAVQPHYIAPPVFCDGLVDPVDERKGLLPGRCDVVAVPVIDISMPGYKHEGGAQGLEAAHGYEAKMALLGDGVGKDGCHAVITRAITSYITVHGPEADREALKADIRKRTAAAPWDRSKHTDEYVAREVSDQTLDRSIEDWIDKALVQREGYAVSKLDDVDTAREKVKNAV